MTAVQAAARWHERQRQQGSFADAVGRYDTLRKKSVIFHGPRSKSFGILTPVLTKLAAHGLSITSDKLGV